MTENNDIDEIEDLAASNTVDPEDTALEEVSESDEPDAPERFEVSSFGWDSDVEGLVKRLKRGDIYVPGFQRGFVWSRTEQSRFIESLILGLPVPTIFLAEDRKTKLLNIIDGQQRLRTLQSYLDGKFSLSGKGLSEDLRGKFHSNKLKERPRAQILLPADERTLENAVIHAIVIKPNPSDDDAEHRQGYNKAIIQIFKRLNTSGKPLQAQEVRASIFYGKFLDLLEDLNNDPNWRNQFGNIHSRLKDQEAILRVLALYSNSRNYKSPMPKFLDDFMDENRDLDTAEVQNLKLRFTLALQLIQDEFGKSAFRSGGTFKLTKLDALMVGLMSAIPNNLVLDDDTALNSLKELFVDRSISDRLAELEADNRGLDHDGNEVPDMPDTDKGYNWSIAQFTNDTGRVQARIRTAKEAFAI